LILSCAAGELAGAPGAAAEFAQDAPVLELGVGAFGGEAQLGVGAVGRLLRYGLVPPAVPGAHMVTAADVAVVREGD
jgi:hypothetical protein